MMKPERKQITIFLQLLLLLWRPSITNGTLLRSSKYIAGPGLDEDVNFRNLLSLTKDAGDCVNSAYDILRNETLELSQLYNLLLGENTVWKQPMELPFSREDETFDGIVKADTRRLPQNTINFDEMKEKCESKVEGGKFLEFNVLIPKEFSMDPSETPSTPTLIKNVPMCIDSALCTNRLETIALEVWIWNDINRMPTVLKASGCDEVGDDQFFVKIKEGEPFIMTCEALSEMNRTRKYPKWMAKHPCEKKWTPSGMPGTARTVCPVTCKQEQCNVNDPDRIFLEDKTTSTTRTCRWLASQKRKKQKLFCKRKHYRKEGFPSIPSAYSACRDTCSIFTTI
jgi:hypothetical protein